MADISIKYKGSQIAEINEKGSKKLKTAGTYCEGDIDVIYTPNSRTYTITVTKASGWVLLTTLDADILEHINDENFTVTLQTLSDYTFVSNYMSPIAIATNKQQANATSSNYPSYGVLLRQSTSTSVTALYIYYPPNKTDTTTTMGGAMFRVADGKYYLRAGDGYVGGTYKLTFSW